MSRLDYSKWDALELSDDSDIEVHPNVDKASFIRWKQQDIHARREQRRQNIQALRRTREMNDGLLTQLRDLSKAASNPKEGVAGILKHINDVRDKAKREGIADTAIPKNPHYVPDEATGQPEEGDAATAKDMEETVPLETVLGTLVDQIETALKTQDEENVRRDLVARLEDQMRRVEERQRDVVMALDKEEKEDKKKITSDNIFHETFDKMMITKPKQPPAPAPTPAPAPAATTKPAEKKSTDKKSTEKRPTKKKTEKVVETLNSGAKPKALTPPPAADDSDDSEELITTPDALDFSKLNGFDASFRYIGAHPHLVSEKVADQILAEAFSAQLAGDEKRAKNCVFQALQLQYCNGLGKDGINLFYAR
ncbi:Cdc37 N terminal kinase binding-domain-containing protein [Jimgerdemannia flammicorona]|uniref:Cdc37 N terminal kinase binding-domain-containing protein n=1 Tax=Jimgerdemannia flammicorona TaxID=994334 RepID=A0A433CXX5_9FUNG|nr:Cdc37 N terminal kinase binding-domain-containing protein [Jimgerdemannia flammicorona]